MSYRIISDGGATGTKIIDQDGNEMPGVQSIEWVCSIEQPFAYAVVRVSGVTLDADCRVIINDARILELEELAALRLDEAKHHAALRQRAEAERDAWIAEVQEQADESTDPAGVMALWRAGVAARLQQKEGE